MSTDDILFIGGVLIILIGVIAMGFFDWWRCGEMFPHAQLACFLR